MKEERGEGYDCMKEEGGGVRGYDCMKEERGEGVRLYEGRKGGGGMTIKEERGEVCWNPLQD